ncbi:MAG: TerB N-terminal domain-containing protein [Desulfobulbaceae bacterium]|nr:TerB N-terminal domain-containing protein [Desulfobulbaceae bacterium]
MADIFWLLVFIYIIYKIIKFIAGTSQKPKITAEDFEIHVSYSDEKAWDGIKNPANPDNLWVPPGQEVKVEQYVIPGGMLYVGKNLPSVSSNYNIEPALINPQLKIASNCPDLSERLTDYWPSYSNISPDARAAYLSWLANGKSDPQADIGYVFLYFYGLERRVLADAKRSPGAASNVPAILSEVERLLSIYGNRGSFRNYAGNFLSFCRANEYISQTLDSAPLPLEKHGWDLPFALKAGLGQIVKDGRPIPADWAFAWMEMHPETRLRTPAQRCPEEFAKLFKIRYQAKYGEGIKIKPNKSLLTLDYRPASGSFSGTGWSHELDLPDVSKVVRPLNKFLEIAYACCDDLDAYSRYLGRNPDSRGSLAALSLVPDELAGETSGAKAGELKALLQRTLSESNESILDATDLLHFWPSNNPGKLTKKETVQFAQLLERWNYGLEPDVRFGGKSLSESDKVLLFRMEGEKISSPSREYSAAMLVLHLAAMVSGADGHIDEEEKQRMEEHLESSLHLSSTERVRLRAHIKWLLVAQPGFAGVKKKLEGIGEHQRIEVGRFLVSVACADGKVDPKEIKVLNKMYNMLGFPETALHSQLHSSMSIASPAASEPITVRTASTVPQGYKIPHQKQQPPQAAVTLDMERIQSTLAETAAVSTLLSDIFSEEEETIPVHTIVETGDTVAGLDHAHSTLLKRLKEQTSWARQELESLVDELGLMLDGAIEMINEAAFEIADMPLCEGEDPIEVDHAVLGEMTA